MSPFSLPPKVSTRWKSIMTFGFLQIALGFVAVAFVGLTSKVSVIYLGLLLMASGISEVIYSIRTHENGDMWFHLLMGVLTAVCGFFVFSNPIVNLVVLTMLIAMLFVVTGLVTLIASVVERDSNWFFFAMSGFVSILAGYMVFQNPIQASVWLIGLFVGTQMIAQGMAWVTLGWAGRSVSRKLRTAVA